jgi:arginine deiminase
VLLTAGNPRTAARLRGAGVEVLEFAGAELCVKGTGGPTCLCFDLARGG